MKRNTILLSGLISLGLACGSKNDQAPQSPKPPAGEQDANEALPPGSSDEVVLNPIVDGPSLPPSEGSPEVPSVPEDKEAGNDLPAIDVLPQWKEIFQAAANGPEIKGVQAYDYQWNVKPASIQRQADGSLEIMGRLSHHIPNAPDDQLDYRFSYKDGKLMTTDISIQAGGWLPIAEPILKILAEYTATPIPLDAILPIIRDIEERIKGKDWQTQGQKLASRIALSIYEKEMTAD